MSPRRKILKLLKWGRKHPKRFDRWKLTRMRKAIRLHIAYFEGQLAAVVHLPHTDTPSHNWISLKGDSTTTGLI